MKKLLALVLCALMLMSAAVAEQNMQAWTVTVDDIAVTYKNETVELSPTLLVQTGRDTAGCWAQISVLLDGASILTGQVEYVNDTLFVSVDGANDALLIPAAEMFLNQYNLSGTQVQAYLNALFNLLATGTDVLTAGMDPEMGVLDIQVVGENEADCTVSKGSYSVSAHLAWESHENELPYDLSAKNICRYTFREMFPGDGTDIPETVNAALRPLYEDESIRELMDLLSDRVAM